MLKFLEFSLIIGGQPVTGGVKVEAVSVNRGEIFRLEQPCPGTRPGKDIVGLVMQGGAAYRGAPPPLMLSCVTYDGTVTRKQTARPPAACPPCTATRTHANPVPFPMIAKTFSLRRL